MTEAAVKEALDAIIRIFSGADKSTGASVMGTYVSNAQEKQNLEEAMNLVRLNVRYLIFDLEATRRENRYLRQLLDSRAKPEGE